jgi:cell division protein FtsB
MKPREFSRRFFAPPQGRRRRSADGPRPIPRWFWLVAGLWLVWVCVLSEHSFLRIARLRHEIARAEADARQLRDETVAKQAQLSDPQAKRDRAEEIARTQHGWAAPGEIVYRFRDDAKADSTRRPALLPMVLHTMLPTRLP